MLVRPSDHDPDYRGTSLLLDPCYSPQIFSVSDGEGEGGEEP